MLEIVVSIVILTIFIIMQILNSKQIEIKAYSSNIKKITSIIISVSLIIVFWQSDWEFNITCILLAALILLYGLNSEGLTKTEIIRFGSIDNKYSKYERIDVEVLSDGSIYMSFFKNGHNQRIEKGYRSEASFSMRFPKNININSIKEFFAEINEDDILNIIG